jgi:hypothetical protein
MKAKKDDKWLSCIAPCSLGPWHLKKKKILGSKFKPDRCGVAGESPASHHPLPLCFIWECQWLVGLVCCCASL